MPSPRQENYSLHSSSRRPHRRTESSFCIFISCSFRSIGRLLFLVGRIYRGLRITRVLNVPTILNLLNCGASNYEGRSRGNNDRDRLRVMDRQDGVTNEGAGRNEARQGRNARRARRQARLRRYEEGEGVLLGGLNVLIRSTIRLHLTLAIIRRFLRVKGSSDLLIF